MVSGAMGWLAEHDADELTAVAIAPDLGERYLDTVYQTNWLQDHYGADVLAPTAPTAARAAGTADRRPGSRERLSDDLPR